MNIATNPRVVYPHILDDLSAIRILDGRNMLGLTEQFPIQCEEALDIATRFAQTLPDRRKPKNIVVTGLGGSAIGGDLVRVLVDLGGDVPLIVNRDYDLPGFVGPDTLVIASSYSGNTEETLTAYAQARQRGSRLICVTSGGKLAQRAREDGVPCCLVPDSRPPRASTGYLFIPTLTIVATYATLGPCCTPAAVEEAIPLLEDCSRRWRREVPLAENPAKQLAVALYGRIPIIYGGQGYPAVLALRWKGQFNENAKVHAFANALPEQNHNEILGWEQALQQSQVWSVVYLRDPEEETAAPRMARRVEILRTVIGNKAEQHEVRAEGTTVLQRMLSMLYFGDFVSVYLALLVGVDPTEIAGIDLLKAELARMDETGSRGTGAGRVS